MSYLMNPESVIERAVARPFIGGGTVRCLNRAGWHLVHAKHETWDDDALHLAPARVDEFKAIVWGVEEGEVSRSVRTTHMFLERALQPEAALKLHLERAWQELALPLGQKLGVLS
jgi:hypothetical protein